MPGEVVTFSGPTAVGKNTILDKFWAMKDVVKRVAYTTRPPRAQELNGVHYHFVTPEEFLNRIARGEFLEYAEVHGNLYGTTRQGLQEVVNSGKSIFFDLDIQGAGQLKAKMPEIITIFVLPPSFVELKRRLDARGSGEDESTKLRRLKRAEEEIRQSSEFDYFVVNDEVDRAVLQVQQLLGILSLGKMPPREKYRDITLIDQLLNEIVVRAPQ